jgi:ribose 5-phosphate isomerase B
MKIALASDHAGFEQLEELEMFLKEAGYQVVNYGPKTLDPTDDYPDFIVPAAEAVARGACEMGIVLGGDGEGEAIVANKLKGVRCAVFYGVAVPKRVVDAGGRVSHDPFEIIKLTRLHNDANMLSMGARFVSNEDMKHVAKLWLETKFSGEERHQRRNDKVNELGG